MQKDLMALLNYQEAETKLEEYERSLKNTETRKKLVQQQQLFKNAQQKLKQLEQETYLAQNNLGEVSAQVEILKKQMDQKNIEIGEISDADADDLFIEDVREIIKECENIRSAIELNKRKVSEIMQGLEKAEADIKDTLVKMSAIKKNFDQLKEAHEKELEAGKEDLDKLRAEVQKAAQGIEASLMDEYKRIKQQRQNPVARFKNGRCQGCNMELPSSVVQTIKSGDKLVTCENCSRILYLEEEA